MAATIEHLSSLVRVGDEMKRHGDPYSFAVAVRWLSPTEVELVGFTAAGSGRLRVTHVRAIKAALEAAGVRVARWTRRTSSSTRSAASFARTARPSASVERTDDA